MDLGQITFAQVVLAGVPTLVSGLILRGLQRQDKRFGAIDTKLESIDKKVDDHGGRLIAAETRIGHLEREVTELRAELRRAG